MHSTTAVVFCGRIGSMLQNIEISNTCRAKPFHRHFDVKKKFSYTDNLYNWLRQVAASGRFNKVNTFGPFHFADSVILRRICVTVTELNV